MAAAGLGAALTITYLALIQNQGVAPGSRVAFYATFIGVMSASSFVAAAVRGLSDRAGQALSYCSALGFLLAGVLGLASVGVGLILAAALAFDAAGPRQLSLGAAAIVAAVPAVVLMLGMAMT